MKQANTILLWIIGLPLGAIVWIAMVGPGTGVATIVCALACLGIGTMYKNRKED